MTASRRLRPRYQDLRLSDLQGLPITRYDLIDLRRYRIPNLPAQTTRGCPYACSYCEVTQVYGAKFRYRPPEEVVEEVKTLMRLYVAPAQECPLDKLGRILIPPALRAHGGLEKDVVWAGMVKVIELWSREGWRKAQDDARGAADSADVMRVLTELRHGREQS